MPGAARAEFEANFTGDINHRRLMQAYAQALGSPPAAPSAIVGGALITPPQREADRPNGGHFARMLLHPKSFKAFIA